MDPLAGSSWSRAETVAGFARSHPNSTLMQFAESEQQRGGRWIVDLGCGAGRNAVPLAHAGWNVVGVDLSWPMLRAAHERARNYELADRLRLVLAPMDAIPVRDRSADLVIAHGIWNLARSAAEFRRAAAEGARVAKPGAALFLFTFSRQTISPDAQPLDGEPFVYTEFSGEPQCFLTADQLLSEMARAGFELDPGVPLREHNLPPPGVPFKPSGPVIYEAAFRRTG
jgi:SAM-dependent methyltransferase